MSFRIAVLNLEQNHKRWDRRRELIIEELDRLRPDIFALNEISIPAQSGRWLQGIAKERLDISYVLIQQSKVNAGSEAEAEGILTRFPVIETANLDLRADDAVAQLVRIEIEGRPLDVYVTHLHKSRGTESVRQFQVARLLDWIHGRNDVRSRIVCGDFNATLEMASAQLMAQTFHPTQTQPTAFTPLEDENGSRSHPYWERMDRCIDYIWVTNSLAVKGSGRCFNRPASGDPTLWPSDHAGVWADLEVIDPEPRSE